MADDLDFGATIKGFSPGQKVLGRYKLVRILGRGGMGVVWLARDEDLEREVALKFLPEIVALDPEAVADMKRETRRNLDLTHPHIVRIHDFISDGRTAAISMEYVNGASFSALKLQKADRIFSPAELRPWLEQLLDALHYAHAKAKVVHRDLKPANLMITREGDLKVADFGIARGISDSVSRVSAQAGSSGTPVYMSPQQMLGEKAAVTDDIYALGATLYELLTSKPPFYSGNVILQVQSKAAPTMAERRKELEIGGEPIPAEWEETMAACLAKEAKDRPQSAGEMAERLGLGAKGNTQRPTSNAQPPTAAPTGAAATPRRTEPQATKPTSKTPLYAGITAGVILLAGLGWYFGVHAPEQKRLAEIARLDFEQKTEEANRLRTEQEKSAAEARARQEQIAAEAKAKLEQERIAAGRLAAARGGLVIRTNPAGAEVRVGAIALDKSPFTLKEQKLGRYPVRVRLDGYEDWTGEVEVKENEFTDLDVALVRSTGRVLLTGPAGATVTAEGRILGTLPLTLESVPTGAVRYAVSLKGHKSAEVSGSVPRNSELRLSAALEKQTFPQAGQPWENSLGQKFVPVPNTEVLFCIWETRVQDFEAFVTATGYDATQAMRSDRGDGQKQQGDTWKSPSFPQGPTHPVVGVNQADAKAFCQWLTKQERSAGRLAPDQEYRLPTDAEWDVAAGPDKFSWGNQWPPPRGAGNLCDDSVKRGRLKGWTIIPGYNDGYDTTAPVGSFAANRLGIYDLSGNVWEYVDDRSSGVRGGSFGSNSGDFIATAYHGTRDYRDLDFGFRVVCAVGSGR